MYYTLKQLKEFVDDRLQLFPEESPIAIYYLLPEDITAKHHITGETISVTNEQKNLMLQKIGNMGEPDQIISHAKYEEIDKITSLFQSTLVEEEPNTDDD